VALQVRVALFLCVCVEVNMNSVVAKCPYDGCQRKMELFFDIFEGQYATCEHCGKLFWLELEVAIISTSTHKLKGYE